MESTGFNLKQGNFEGPLELLLSLVEERKLFVNEVSLATVADEFISYIEQQGKVTMAETAGFVLTASTLLLIKARSLLPQLSLTDEESASIDDLQKRLRELAEIHLKTKLISPLMGTTPLYVREYHENFSAVFAPPKNEQLALAEFLVILNDILKRIPQNLEIMQKTIIKTMVSLESVMFSLAERIEKGLKLSFKSISENTATKDGRGKTIVSFLALLELVKRGLVLVKQGGHFEDIRMESNSVSLPYYG